MQQVDGIFRRNRLDLITKEELEIYNLMQKVEGLGCHPLLTDVVTLLAEARNKLADFVELENKEQ